MNERIRELAQQSQLAELYDRYVEQCIKNADDDILDYDVIVKEFAELIVRECIQAVKNVGGYNEDYHMNAIKKYFGVKE